MKRAVGVLLVAVGAFFGIGMVATLTESSGPNDSLPLGPNDSLPLTLVTLSFAGAGTAILRTIERPIFSPGRATKVISTVFLVIAAFFAVMFIAILGEGTSGDSLLGEGVIPLYLALVFGGCGVGLRGTETFGSFAGNLTVLGVGAVVALVLILLFVFANTFGNGEVPVEILAITMALMAVGAGAVWFWSRRAVAPMAEITEVANEIQAGSLDRRIGLRSGVKEVRHLAESFDRMLDRLSLASGTQQRMLEDASHELRTPLAALAINNEVALNATDPSPEDYRSTIERNQALVERMQTTIDDLLAEGRANNQQLQQVDNDLMAIVHRVADQHRGVNPQTPISVRGPHELRLGIDGPSVERAVENLVQNAARYSPSGVPVEISVISGEVENRLSVTDHGPGIRPEDLDEIFDRYYQGDAEDSGTAGIGLALVKQVADAHGGVDVTSPISDNGGTRFTITFHRGV